MKLSDAMQRGSRKYKETKEQFFNGTCHRGIYRGAACPLGTAALTLGFNGETAVTIEGEEIENLVKVFLEGRFPRLFSRQVENPTAPNTGGMESVGDLVVELVDNQGWTRQRIIKWLKSIGW